MAMWQQMIQENMKADREARKDASMSVGLNDALNKMWDHYGERRGQADKQSNIKEQAYYSKYPDQAGLEMGKKPPARPDVSGATSGLNKSGVTVDKSGNISTTYKSPDTVDAGFLIKQYTSWRATLEANSIGKVDIPQFGDWVTANFPEYADEILQQTKETKEITDEMLDGLPPINGKAVTLEDLETTAEEEGMSVWAVYQALLK